MEFTSRIVTYKELRDGLEIKHDPYGILSYEYETRRRAFLANPNLRDENDTYAYVVETDGAPIGRTYLFDSKIKVGDEIFPLYSGSGLEVVSEFRKFGVGGELFAYSRSIKKRERLLSAGISDMALPLYKAMKYHIFEFPKMLRLNDVRPLLGKYGFKGILMNFMRWSGNAVLHLYYSLGTYKANRLKKAYQLERVEHVPGWVDEIVKNDGHKYAELHDKEWLQWNLDYNFKGHKRDIQSFYIIKKDGENVGFVMTKERFRPEVHGMTDVLIGSIVEWGIDSRSSLTEPDVYRLVLSTFSYDVDIIETATNDDVAIKKLKLMGFVHHGDAHIAIKDKTKKLKDVGDATLWRLRYGYADVILT